MKSDIDKAANAYAFAEQMRPREILSGLKEQGEIISDIFMTARDAFHAGSQSRQPEINQLIEALGEMRWIPIDDRSRIMSNDTPIFIKDENGRVYTWEEWDSFDSPPLVIITHWRPIDTPKATQLLEKYGKK